MSSQIDVIFVPQGAEYQAVSRGLRAAKSPDFPAIVPLSIGSTATQAIAETWLSEQKNAENPAQTALLMGLCGGLNPTYPIGKAVLCQTCLAWNFDQPVLTCDRDLNSRLVACLDLPLVSAITSDRIVNTAQEKQALSRDRNADIVEMEGYPLIGLLQQAGLQVAMLRVISDDCHHDLPDLSSAIAEDGNLHLARLALSFFHHPIGAARLIRGSLLGLNVLERSTTKLFKLSF